MNAEKTAKIQCFLLLFTPFTVTFFIIAYFGTNRDSCPERQEFFYINLHNSYVKRTNIVHNKQESFATNKSFMMQIMVILNKYRLYRTKKSA